MEKAQGRGGNSPRNSLLLLSARTLVRQSSPQNLSHLLSSIEIPAGIYPILLAAATSQEAYGGGWSPVAARIILNHWPGDCVQLREIDSTAKRMLGIEHCLTEPEPADDECRGWPYYEDGYDVERTLKFRQALHIRLLWSFLDIVCQGPNGGLTTLDLRGVQVKDVNKALSHHFYLLMDPMIKMFNGELIL